MKKDSVSAMEENESEDNSISGIYDCLRLNEPEFFSAEFLMWFKNRIFPGDDNSDDENKQERRV